MMMCRSQLFTGLLVLLQVFAVFAACLLSVHGAPAPETMAMVNGNEVHVMEPFQYIEHKGVMQIKKCMDFTHSIVCNFGARQVSEERIYNKLTPCPKEENPPDAAAAVQGSKFSVLLCVVLLMIFYGWF